MKTVWKFWTMFHFGSLEAWLSEMASQGWIFQGVRLRYGFMFKKMKPSSIVYRFDYRGYLMDDYMTELIHKNWVMTKINKHWLVWSKPSQSKDVVLDSYYNEDVLQAMKRLSVIQGVLCVLCWVLPRYVLADELHIPLLLVVYFIACLFMTYNVIRCLFYKAMIEIRMESQ